MGKSDYDGAELERLWKILLVNQFHDILPGSSIHEVYENAREDYAELNRGLEKLINEKLNVLFSERDPEAFTVVNYLNVPYTGEVKIKLPEGYNSVEYADEQIPCVKLSDKTGDYISFVAEKIPSLSGRTYRFSKSEHPTKTCVKAEKNLLENNILRVEFDNNGEITSVFDKENDREALAAVGNTLCIYQDKPIHESAWNLEFDYRMTPYPLKTAESVEVVRSDSVAGELKILRKFNKSTVTQYISLKKDSRQIDFRTAVDWHEREKVLKVNFPVGVRSCSSTSEIAHGSMQRPTHYNTSYDLAKFETCMHKWVDLSESGYGVSVLNDCKYGFSVHENNIDITLMRAPICPDPTGDIGYNEFTYSLVPHVGTWQEAGISELAYALNNPPAVVYSHEHHLRTGLQRECLVGREEHLWILAFDGGSVGIGLAGELFELVVVDALCLPVVRRKTYVAVFLARLEVGYIARVERREHRSVGSVFSHLIQYVEETLVALAIHLCQFDDGVACALQGERREEVRRGVIAREHLPLVVLSHRSKLAQVADHNHLNAAKRKVVLAETAQHAVYGIEKVGTHHRYLVDDERVDRTDDVYLLFGEAELLFLEIIVGYERRKRQLEERVDGHTFGVDGSNARRRYHHDALRRLLLQSAQKGGLSSASLTGEEEVGVRCLYYVPSELRLLCHFLC